MTFKFYVLNYNFNEDKVEMFNIFRNCKVSEYTEKAIKEYLKSPEEYKYENNREEILYGFEGLCEEIKGLIYWQESGRCEYEIRVTSVIDENGYRLKKWDCYKQAEANIEAITRECLYQYEHRNE